MRGIFTLMRSSCIALVEYIAFCATDCAGSLVQLTLIRRSIACRHVSLINDTISYRYHEMYFRLFTEYSKRNHNSWFFIFEWKTNTIFFILISLSSFKIYQWPMWWFQFHASHAYRIRKPSFSCSPIKQKNWMLLIILWMWCSIKNNFRKIIIVKKLPKYPHFLLFYDELLYSERS